MDEQTGGRVRQVLRDYQDLVVWRLSRADALAFAQAILEPGEPDEQMRADYARYLEMKRLSRPVAPSNRD